MKRILFIVLGIICVGLAMLGMVVPLLPTTPFLLLALWLFLRSSPRLAKWLLTNKFCGEYLDNYRQGRGIPLRVKIFVVSLLWLSIGCTSLCVVNVLWLRLLLLVIASVVTYHISTFPTLKK